MQHGSLSYFVYSLHINLYEKLKLYYPKLGNIDYVQFNVTCFNTVTPAETFINWFPCFKIPPT